MDRPGVTVRATTADIMLGEERRRLARDLHNAVGNRLTMISLNARSADHDRVRQRLTSIDEVAQQAMRHMGWIVHGLRGGSAFLAEDSTTVMDAVYEVIDEFRGLAPPIPVEVSGGDVCPPPGVRRLARQVVREAVINGMKHGELRDVRVELFVDDDVDLRVWTRGDEERADQRGIGGFGLGLVGLAEQAHDYGGVLEAGRTIRGWFVVRARIPLVWTSMTPITRDDTAIASLEAPAA